MVEVGYPSTGQTPTHTNVQATLGEDSLVNPQENTFATPQENALATLKKVIPVHEWVMEVVVGC